MIVLKHILCPGDIAVMTVVPREIYRQYPGKFEIAVQTNHPDIWSGNPFITRHFGAKATLPSTAKVVKIAYDVKLAHTGRHHFMHAYLQKAVDMLKPHGITSLPLTELRPCIQLKEEEKEARPLRGEPYWLICTGGKYDYTPKWWDPESWQKLGLMLAFEPSVPRLIQVGKTDDAFHPCVKSAMDYRDRSTLRNLIWLVAHSSGVICGVTMIMHLAAAFQKPCVVVAGGREPWWWDSYDKRMLKRFLPDVPDKFKHLINTMIPHIYLDTLGKLPCCKDDGCWKASLIDKNDRPCSNVVLKDKYAGPSINLALCMKRITPTQVLEAVMTYVKGV